MTEGVLEGLCAQLFFFPTWRVRLVFLYHCCRGRLSHAERAADNLRHPPPPSLLSFRKVRRVNHEVVQTAASAYTSATCWCAVCVCGTFWIDFFPQIEHLSCSADARISLLNFPVNVLSLSLSV